MKPSKHTFLAALALTASLVLAGSNPLLVQNDQVVDIAAIKGEHVAEATQTIMTEAKKGLATIYAVPAKKRTFANTMLAMDSVSFDAFRVGGHIYLLGNTSPAEGVRNQCQQSMMVLGKFANDLGLDEDLYRSVKEYAATKEAQALKGYRKKFVADTLRNFEQNGFALNAEDRAKLKEIQNQISEKSLAFSRNISAHQDTLIVSEADINGLPEDFKKARRQEDGTYAITLDYPSYGPFMKFSQSESARKKLYMKYQNRAADKNLPLLKEVLVLRQKMAKLLGHSTFAAYQLESRMAKNPATVWAFEERLSKTIKAKVDADYAELLAVKRAKLGNKSIHTINPWESAFYKDILLRDKYKLDSEQIKEYFPIEQVKKGLFHISQNLFDVTFKEVEKASVWHEDVGLYEVLSKGKVIGRFYLDLHPRANKYTHAACFPMKGSRKTAKGRDIPTASLVCNFPKASADKPALMPHNQVETFFHEFGHVLHNMLADVEIGAQAGGAVARDFVEAPSQIFENWAWNYEALQLFAKHYKTGEVLPRALFDRMVAAKNVGSGISTAQQIFYGVLDMTLHDRFNPNSKTSTSEVVRELSGKYTPYRYPDGSHMEAAFGHLMGYAAGYYGYLWSNVYAQDMFSVFEKNGIMDPATGKAYRDKILAPGNSIDELEMVRQFLGREPNEQAFLRSLGLKKTKVPQN